MIKVFYEDLLFLATVIFTFIINNPGIIVDKK